MLRELLAGPLASNAPPAHDDRPVRGGADAAAPAGRRPRRPGRAEPTGQIGGRAMLGPGRVADRPARPRSPATRPAADRRRQDATAAAGETSRARSHVGRRPGTAGQRIPTPPTGTGAHAPAAARTPPSGSTPAAPAGLPPAGATGSGLPPAGRLRRRHRGHPAAGGGYARQP